MMVLITAGAALAAELHRSQGLAIFAVAGGFLTPFLVGGGQNAQVVLLSYDAILAMGTMIMAARRGWPFLNLLSYAFVVLTFLGWAATSTRRRSGSPPRYFSRSSARCSRGLARAPAAHAAMKRTSWARCCSPRRWPSTRPRSPISSRTGWRCSSTSRWHRSRARRPA